MEAANIITLDYARADSAGFAPDRWRWVFLALSLPGLAAIFLPFTWDVSPWDAVLEVPDAIEDFAFGRRSDGILTLLGVPFLLALPSILLQLRMLWARPLSMAESIIVWCLAALSSICTVGFLMILGIEMLKHANMEPVLPLAGSAAVLILGGAALLLRRRHLTQARRGLFALEVAYLANAALCLIGFRDNPDPGYWVTLGVSAVWVLSACRLAFGAPGSMPFVHSLAAPPPQQR